VDYVLALNSETSLSDNYRRNIIVALKLLAESCCRAASSNEPFKSMAKEDVIDFVDKHGETEMTLHKWKGTYNLSERLIVKFFKWLYYPYVPPNRRPEPPIIQNLGKLMRLEESIYKPSDLSTSENYYIFLKYCPNVRDRCFHTMAMDTAAKPHEPLKLNKGC
jgi:hypothetical protein